MDEGWEDEDCCNGDCCEGMLTGYQLSVELDVLNIYQFPCESCQLRHRCAVGVMVICEPRTECMIEQEAP